MPDASQFAPAIMNRFTGSETWYRHPLNRKILYTDGARHVADAEVRASAQTASWMPTKLITPGQQGSKLAYISKAKRPGLPGRFCIKPRRPSSMRPLRGRC